MIPATNTSSLSCLTITVLRISLPKLSLSERALRQGQPDLGTAFDVIDDPLKPADDQDDDSNKFKPRSHS